MADQRQQKQQRKAPSIDVAGLPANVDAERMVLWAMMSAESDRDEVLTILQSDDFIIQPNRRIFDTIRDLNETGMGIDIVTVANALDSVGQLNLVGGLSYLASLDDGLPRMFNVRSYAEIVKEKSANRKLIFVAQKMVDVIMLGESTALDVIQRTEAKLAEISSGVNVKSGQSLGEFIAERGVDYLADVLNRQRGISTGFANLDEMTNGLYPGDIFIVGARPGAGKTAFALNLADNIASKDDGDGAVVFFSLEMLKDPLFDRLLARASGLDFKMLRKDGITDAERFELRKAIALLRDVPIILDETPGLSMADIQSRVLSIQAERKVAAVVVDYVQLLRPSDRKRRYANENETLTEISNDVQFVTKKLRLPFVVLSQLRRPTDKAAANKEPTIEELRGSGSLEQIGWRILLLHRTDKAENEATRGSVSAILGKNRIGEIGTIKMRFNGATTRFTEVGDDY